MTENMLFPQKRLTFPNGVVHNFHDIDSDKKDLFHSHLLWKPPKEIVMEHERRVGKSEKIAEYLLRYDYQTKNIMQMQFNVIFN
jgi:hypothetical protein